MTVAARGLRRGAGRIGRSIGGVWTGIAAVSAKELRGRMRGRRAFVVVTIYLLLLSLFAFGIYHFLKQRELQESMIFPGAGFPESGVDFGFPGPMTAGNTGLSATIGHALFSGLLAIETLLVLVLAPAFTSGAISLEREKQTIDLLVTTPLSTLGMVIGKLFSALIYVFLLIVASIPLASVVFAFGGVGPEDLVRGYVFLFALAFGMGAMGLFVSALVRRTQTATVMTFIGVLVLTLGTVAVHSFWMVSSRPTATEGGITVQRRHEAPEALLWLNPFVANADLVCTTAPTGYHESCVYMSAVTGKPYFGSSFNAFGCPPNARCAPGNEGGVVIIDDVAAAAPPRECAEKGCGGIAFEDVLVEPLPVPQTVGFPRDTFWPRSAAAFVGVGALLTLLSAQLVSPTRRFRMPRPSRRPRGGTDHEVLA